MIHRVIATGIAFSLMLSLGFGDTASLDGEWEVCRTETGDAPAAGAEWEKVRVPSFLGYERGKPFVWYRRSFTVPAGWAGRHVFLKFQAVKFVTEVHVNGAKVGGHTGGWEPFELDITKVCRIGRPNGLLVRAQDVTGVIAQPMGKRELARGERFIAEARDSIMTPIGSQFSNFGIWEPVSLIARRDVYVEHVFVRTSVRTRQIEAEITLRNLSARPRRVHLAASVKEGIKVGEADVDVTAGRSAKLTLARAWPNPRLWGPEDPHLYVLSVQLAEGEAILDTSTTRFGFREFWTDGIYHVLNGTRINFLATAGHPRGQPGNGLSKASAIDFYRRIREAGCVAMRLHANVWPKAWFEAADEAGMPLIMESALFCYCRSYALTKPQFWHNYHDHLRAIVRDHCNHPSIVMISLENEILHCGGEQYAEDCEHRLAEAGRLVKSLDPTRPIMYDADGDPEGVADVVNLHYPLNFSKHNLWPDACYWLEKGMKVSGWPRTFWTWDRKKPLYFGEFLHIQHYREPDPFTILLGDDAYTGYADAMARCKAMAWDMQLQAYRACDLSGMCPWTLTETGDFPSDTNLRYLAVKHAYQKNAAFIRQYDTRFYERETIPRTVYLYNDTLHPARLTLQWELKRGDAVVGSGTRKLDAQPAQKHTLTLGLKMPAAARRTPLTLTLTVLNGGRKAFQEAKTCWVFPRTKVRAPKGVRIALFEGASKVVSQALEPTGADLVHVADLARLPKARILVIGPHALDGLKPQGEALVVGGDSGVRQAIASFVRDGGSVVVLEQDSYAGGLVPATLLDHGCTIAFQRSRDGRLFAGTRGDDFRFWRGDHVVARKTIAKPLQGRFRALVDAGGAGGLVYLPLCEILSGRGRTILSQLAIGEKLGKEPLAQVMLENILAYAARPVPPTVKLAVVHDKLPMTDMLNEIDAVFTDISGKLGGTDLRGFGVLLAEADCAEVAGSQAKLKQFVAGGGTVVLHGGTKAGIARLQGIFPEKLVAQRTSAVPVTIAEWDPAIDGLTNQELHWYGDRKDMSWRVRTPLSTAVCSHMVGAGEPDPKACKSVEAEAMAVAWGSPTRYDDHVGMHATAAVRTTIDFPRTGVYAFIIRGRGTPLAGVYPQVAVRIDDRGRGGVTIDTEKWGTAFCTARVEKGRHEITLAFVNDAWDPARGEDRNVWLDKLTYGPLPALKSKRLLNPPALVRVPMGKGFTLLDQIAWSGEAADGEKAGRYLSNLLTNLGCDFGSRTASVRIPADKLLPEEGVKLYRQLGGVLYLGTNGTVFATVRFARAGRYQFAIKASGTEAGGEFPNIALSIDGKQIGDVTLRRSNWQTLRLEADVPAGQHKVSLSFTNDFYDPPADRNLRIGHLEIR